MDRFGALVFLCVSWLMAPFGSKAQGPETIAGHVYCEADSPATRNIQVILSDAEQIQLVTVATGEEGEFRFDGLKRGNYTVNVNAPGYEPESMKVDISGLSKKDLAIYLKRISKNQDSPKADSISTHELSMPVKARNFMESGKKKLYQDKDSAGGVVDFEQALSLAPGYYEAHFQLAMAYLAVGKSGEAEKHFRKSIEVSGDKYGEAEVGLGAMMLDQQGHRAESQLVAWPLRVFLNEKRVSEAQSSAERARQSAPNAPVVYRLLSNIHLLEKDYAALLQDIDEYLKLDPASPAGIRAKELREQVQQKMAAEHLMSTAKP